MWWVWNPDGQRAFQFIDPILWDLVAHNPVAFLRRVERERLNAAVGQPAYIEHYDNTLAKFDAYLTDSNTWFHQTYPDLTKKTIAYFSFEFGIHESLPVYAGGLGILSGDHLKEASDLGLPVVGVGFVYDKGYFVQELTEDGWQETRNYLIDFEMLPLIALLGEDRKPLTISIDLPGRPIYARIWELQVGRAHLYLLDSNVEANAAADRQLTERLYSNDLEIRISQEMLLGMGGVKVLSLLGYEP